MSLIREAIYKQFKQVVQLSVEISRTNRALHQDNQKMLSPAAWCREFATVHVNCGRCTGKTELIKQLADRDSVVICHNTAFAEMYRRAGVYATTPFSLARQYEHLDAPRVSLIFIDEPALTLRDPGSEEAVYNILSHRNATFILLGA